MSTNKPPQRPDKTVLGLPSAQPGRPGVRPAPQQTSVDGSTLVGNPFPVLPPPPQETPLPRATTRPSDQPAAAPPLRVQAPPFTASTPAPEQARPAAGLAGRTLFGRPNHVDAAIEQLRGPNAQPSVPLMHSNRPAGVPGWPAPPTAAAAPGSTETPASSASQRRIVPTRAIQVNSPEPVPSSDQSGSLAMSGRVPSPPSAAGAPVSSPPLQTIARALDQAGDSAQARTLTPHAEPEPDGANQKRPIRSGVRPSVQAKDGSSGGLAAPPALDPLIAADRELSGLIARVKARGDAMGPLVGGGKPSALLMATELIPSFEPATKLSSEVDPIHTAEAPDFERAVDHRLKLDESNTNRRVASKPQPVRRWPALALLGTAVALFGAVIVIRAPALLPAPVAELVGRLVPSGQRARELAPPPNHQPAPPNAGPGAELKPLAPVSPGEVAAPAPDDPSTASAVPPPSAASTGHAQPLGAASAQLEKQAIDLLLANDYEAARAVYQRLRAAEPSRPEYPMMLELLRRELVAGCGGEGQPPCPRP